ncbi:MAG TPA: tRNA (adenosine(37)-N6)-dimethylallyltransferase MiaA [Candidatus Fraserbacteria bacterium]|nr:tRNA (adenosine(37)-N6)-dimethylallyltransferase MiaA [Candidatus Fraserbacteria bacterium]
MSAEPAAIILGATASGKSGLAYQLALRLPGEIISADSRGFYRGLDIGTAKPPPDWRAQVPHHLIDICELDQPYNVMDFRCAVARLLPQIRARGRRPLIVGGSMLYLHVLTAGLFAGPPADPRLRQALSQVPLAELYGQLKQIDPEAAGRIHPHDRGRLVRALEVYRLSGRPISEWQHQKTRPLLKNFLKIGLCLERAKLYRRIARRLQEQLERGLLNEARALHGRLRPGMPAYKTLGYPELFAYLEGYCSLDQAITQIEKHTRHYARRQLIWFRRDPQIHWIDVSDKSPAEITSEALELLS